MYSFKQNFGSRTDSLFKEKVIKMIRFNIINKLTIGKHN